MGFALDCREEKVMDGRTLLHRFRYHMASGFVTRTDTVLDLGCGAGYGTDILSGKAGQVFAYDFEQSNIDGAISNYSWPNNSFTRADLETLDLPKADVAVMFEVLEHLKDPRKFAKQMKEKVSKYIVCSVPLGQELEWDEERQFFHEKGDHTHLSVFGTEDEFKSLFLDDKWSVYFTFRSGVTFICIFYKHE